MWSMVKLAALRALGLTRTTAYAPRPAWYPQQPNDRASQSDIVAVLRKTLPFSALTQSKEGTTFP